MEEKIYQKIIAALGKTNLSERTLRQFAKSYAKRFTTEEDLTDEVISDAVEDLKSLEGQFSHDVSSQVEEQLKKKTSKKTEGQPEPPTGLDDDTKKELAEMKAWVAEMKAAQKAELEKKAREAYLNNVSEKMKSEGCVDKDIVQLIMLRNNIDISKGVDDTVKVLKADYDKTLSERIAGGASPLTSGGLGPQVKQMSDEDRAAAVKADIAALAEMGATI